MMLLKVSKKKKRYQLNFLTVAPSVKLLLHSVLFFLEPRFHPLIREGHIEILFRTVYRLTKARGREGSQQLVPDIGHFPLHLQSYARAFVGTKLKESMKEPWSRRMRATRKGKE